MTIVLPFGSWYQAVGLGEYRIQLIRLPRHVGEHDAAPVVDASDARRWIQRGHLSQLAPRGCRTARQSKWLILA